MNNPSERNNKLDRLEYFCGRKNEQSLFFRRLSEFLHKGKTQHLHFYGVSGVGKSTLIDKCIKKLDQTGKKQKEILVLSCDLQYSGGSSEERLRVFRSQLAEQVNAWLPSYDQANLILQKKRNLEYKFEDLDKGILSWLGVVADLASSTLSLPIPDIRKTVGRWGDKAIYI